MNPLSRPFTISRPLISADGGADGEQHQDAEVRAEVGAAAEGGDRHDQPGRDHRRQAEGRLQRQVHAADQQDQALADHDHAERGALLADAGEVRHGEEHRADHRADDDSTTSTGSSATSRSTLTFDAAQPGPERRAAGRAPRSRRPACLSGVAARPPDSVRRSFRRASVARCHPSLGLLAARSAAVDRHALGREDQRVTVEGRLG